MVMFLFEAEKYPRTIRPECVCTTRNVKILDSILIFPYLSTEELRMVYIALFSLPSLKTPNSL